MDMAEGQEGEGGMHGESNMETHIQFSSVTQSCPTLCDPIDGSPSAIKRSTFDSVLIKWMNLEPTIRSEGSQKEKNKYHILMHIYEI